MEATSSSVVTILSLFAGASAGSFVSAWVPRALRGESVVWGRSHCDRCNTALRWWELIPIVSFVMLRGRCSRCATPIGWDVALVEVMLSVLFLALAWRGGVLTNPTAITAWATTIAWWLFATVAVAVAWYDVLTLTVPDRWLVAGTALALLVGLMEAELRWQAFVVSHMFGACVVGAPLAALWIVSRGKWVGSGDIALAAWAGATLGMVGGFSALLWSFWLGAAFVAVWWCTAHLSAHIVPPQRGHAVPFGPFLVGGLFMEVLSASHIASVYWMV